VEFRHLIRVFGPSWLKTDLVTTPDGVEHKVDARPPYALLSLLDLLRLRLRYGIRARMPGLAPVDALQYVGRGLDTLQGPSESIAAYRLRLQTAIDDKRLAGTAWPLLRQLQSYCSPYPVRVRLVNEHGHFYTRDRDGTESRFRYSAWNWDNGRANALAKGYVRNRIGPGGISVPSPAIPWSQFWIIMYPTTGTPSQPWQRKKWNDGGQWGDGKGTWGSTATHGDVFAIRRIIRRWKPAGSRCVSIIISFDDTAYDPATMTAPIDGTWARAPKLVDGVLVNGRDPNSLFWDGTLPGSVL
jgi:hypothetical protein